MDDMVRWTAEVAVTGEGVWHRNALTYDTAEEAAEAGRDLASRWMLVRAVRVVRADAPARGPVDLPDPAVVWPART